MKSVWHVILPSEDTDRIIHSYVRIMYGSNNTLVRSNNVSVSRRRSEVSPLVFQHEIGDSSPVVGPQSPNCRNGCLAPFGARRRRAARNEADHIIL